MLPSVVTLQTGMCLNSWILVDVCGFWLAGTKPILAHVLCIISLLFISAQKPNNTHIRPYRDFKEAMDITSKAKEGFPSNIDDLYQRGARLIEESVENGVTSMRAHVEVDSIVGFSCLDVALDLQSRYQDICDVQIAVFAQEALFKNASDTEPGENYDILCQAMRREGVTVVGSAPYVEPTTEQAKKNIRLIFDAVMGSRELAATFHRHIDFHLDYNLDPATEPLIHEVIAQARSYFSLCGRKNCSAGPSITIGHATRLQLLTTTEWHDLRAAIGELPITIVGLPQSDMYIQGRAHQGSPLGPPRSTLRVPYIEKAYGIKVAMAVNNVDNAFTPQGTLDPLSSLVTFGVAIFQAVTPREVRTLIEAVTLTSRRALGFGSKYLIPVTQSTASGEKDRENVPKAEGDQRGGTQAPIPVDLFPTRGDPADFVVLHDNSSLRSAALHPSFERTTIKNGRVVARRRKWRWISGATNWPP
ncbi:Cytosine deaminase [Leucoagaricus sp. SymC.cos]|nr:Cytosine deaminase [Leucoagaricus sp. SymC.cos]